MKKVLSALLGFIGSVFLVSCVTSSNGNGGGSGVTQETNAYVVVGNQVITQVPAVIGFYCSSTAVVSDTTPARSDTIQFRITGNTLSFLTHASMPSGAEVNKLQSFQRVGSGSGLIGTWKSTGYSHEVTLGSLTYADSINLAQAETMDSLNSFFLNQQITVTATQVTTTTDPDNSGRFIAQWDGKLGSGSAPDSAVYSITVRAIDKNTVELKGLKNNETVRITQGNL